MRRKEMISFKVSKADAGVIEQIADRGVRMALESGGDYAKLDAIMDITAVHANGCALRLVPLLTADGFNFAHDVFGIRGHLNRQTGKLERCFLPRFALPDRSYFRWLSKETGRPASELRAEALR